MSDRGVLDTSVFIASESGRPLNEDLLPEEAAVSVVTLAELQAGVLAAQDTQTRARRMATLDVLNDIEILPIDVDVDVDLGAVAGVTGRSRPPDQSE